MPSTATQRTAANAARRAIPVVPRVAAVRTTLGVLVGLLRSDSTGETPLSTPRGAVVFRARARAVLGVLVGEGTIGAADAALVESVLDGSLRPADEWSDTWLAHLTGLLEAADA